MPNQGKKRFGVLLLATVGTVVIVAGAILAYFYYQANSSLYITDTHVEELDDHKDKKMQQQQGGGAVNLRFSNIMYCSPREKAVYFQFDNPYRSNQGIQLNLKYKDKIIAKSKGIPPGYRLTMMKLERGAELPSEDMARGELIIQYYDETTKEPLVMTTTLPVELHMKP